MSSKHGLQPDFDAAARALQEQRMAERAEELRQLELLDPVTPEEIAEARQELGAGAGKLAILAEARRRKRGRPPGARNRRNDDLSKYLLQFGTDPLVGAMIVQSTPTEVLMDLSGKTYLECLDRQIRCRELLAPYFHSKRPVAADLTLKGDIRLIEEITDPSRIRHDAIEGEFVRVLPLDDEPLDDARDERGEAA